MFYCLLCDRNQGLTKGRWRKEKRKKRREEDDKKGRHETRRNPWPHVAWNLVGATESHKWLCSVNCADRESTECYLWDHPGKELI